jgi:hypothetical protein
MTACVAFEAVEAEVGRERGLKRTRNRGALGVGEHVPARECEPDEGGGSRMPQWYVTLEMRSLRRTGTRASNVA